MPARSATGLAALDASLAISLVRPTPTEQSSRELLGHPAADGRGRCTSAVAQEPPRPGDVEERLVEPDRLRPAGSPTAKIACSLPRSPRRSGGTGRRRTRRWGTAGGPASTAWPSGRRTPAPRRCTTATTPRRPEPPTMTGRPASDGIVEHLHRRRRRRPCPHGGWPGSTPSGVSGGIAACPAPGPALSHRGAAAESLGEGHAGPAAGVLGAQPHRRRRPIPPRRGTGCGGSRPPRTFTSTVSVMSTHTSGSRRARQVDRRDLVGGPGLGEVVREGGGRRDGVQQRPSGRPVVPVVEVLLPEEDRRRIGPEHHVGAEAPDRPPPGCPAARGRPPARRPDNRGPRWTATPTSRRRRPSSPARRSRQVGRVHGRRRRYPGRRRCRRAGRTSHPASPSGPGCPRTPRRHRRDGRRRPGPGRATSISRARPPSGAGLTVSLGGGGLGQEADLASEVLDALESLVDAGEAHVGDFVERPQALEHGQSHLFAGGLGSGPRATGPPPRAASSSSCSSVTGRFLLADRTPSMTFPRSNGSRCARPLDDPQGDLVDPLERREPSPAPQALPPAADGRPVLGHARVDDPVIVDGAPRTAHMAEDTGSTLAAGVVTVWRCAHRGPPSVNRSAGPGGPRGRRGSDGSMTAAIERSESPGRTT